MTYLFYIIVVSIVVILFLFTKQQKFPQDEINYASKCYSCENQYPHPYAWMGGKSKCFSCERDSFMRSHGNLCSVVNEHPIKYYSSEPYRGMGYAKAGYVVY